MNELARHGMSNKANSVERGTERKKRHSPVPCGFGPRPEKGTNASRPEVLRHGRVVLHEPRADDSACGLAKSEHTGDFGSRDFKDGSSLSVGNLTDHAADAFEARVIVVIRYDDNELASVLRDKAFGPSPEAREFDPFPRALGDASWAEDGWRGVLEHGCSQEPRADRDADDASRHAVTHAPHATAACGSTGYIPPADARTTLRER